MTERPPYHRIIAGDAGMWAMPIRGALRVAEGLYACGVAVRNRWYDHRGPRAVLPVPVISVGNITAGGTGKTPLVIDLLGRLERMGCSPAVVSRGYKAYRDQPNDEERVIRAHCPGVACVSDPDRIRGGELALARFGADVIVLDDGFQHRRLGRTLDIVVVDATCPFGYGHLLPRGLLREPARNLSRADIIVITRSDQVSPVNLSRLGERLRNIARGAKHLECTHQVTGIDRLDGTPVEEPMAGKRAVLFAGLGHPQAFAATVRSLGVEIVGTSWRPDHHRYRGRDIEALLAPGRFGPHELLLTTEKDAVKIAELGDLQHLGIAVVKIAIDFRGDGGTILQSVLEQKISKS